MFEGFEAHRVDVSHGRVASVVGGTGPAVLLLHGHPQTHAMWHQVAPRIVEAGFTVVATDLRGYGDSVTSLMDDPTAFSKRAMAARSVVRPG